MTRGSLLLNGRYRLADQLAAGGMGEVWKGTDELLGRQIAVKLLKHEYATDATFRARFRAEAQYTARLSHPGIAQVYDYGEQDDVAFLVMELVPGEPLSAILARHGRLTSDATLDIVSQAARALQSAHDVGLIHRDIKPGNLIVMPDGTVKVTDFGIARAAEAVTLTQTGMVMGTAHYVSPEQATGKTLTPATDIYSLGVVAYECLRGAPPFTAETVVTVALQHVRESPPPLPDEVPEPVQELVALALEKDPAARPRSAGEFADRARLVRESVAFGTAATPESDAGETTLTELLAASDAPGPTEVTPRPGETAATELVGGPTRQTPVTGTAAVEPFEYETDPPRRRRTSVLALSAVLVVVAALVIGAMWAGDRTGDRQARPTRSTGGPSSAEAVPPSTDLTGSATPIPERTSGDRRRGGGPGGNISPRQTPEPPPTGSPRPSTSSSAAPSPTKTSQEPTTSPDGTPQRDIEED